MNKEFRIECEECDNISLVQVETIEEEPVFCPMCGRRANCDELDNAEESWEDEESGKEYND